MKDGRNLAHLDEWDDGRGTTVAVDDPRYAQKLPFDVQTTGNVWRWILFNAQFKRDGKYFWGSYGLRGGSWAYFPDGGRASCRDYDHPGDRSSDVGFSPVVVRQDAPA